MEEYIMPKLNDRTGERNLNKYGFEMEIIEYVNNKDITVIFLETGSVVKCGYASFNKGITKSPYDKTVYGIGFIGEGKYPTTINGINTQAYKVWHGMMRRGYDKDFKKKSPTYRDVTVDRKWHNYQIFAEWYDQNYYEVDGEKMNLDKDILIKGNKVYSPETCLFVPAKINTMFVNCETNHGKYSTCVYDSIRSDKKYSVRTNSEFIGNFNNLEEAKRAYKRHKEIVFRDTANEYKDRIPEKLYQAMLNYKIDINYDANKVVSDEVLI